MSEPTEEESERFNQDKALLEILVGLTDAENAQPAMRIENAVFALLEVAANGGKFGDLDFEYRRDLREIMGHRLDLAMHRFQRQFEIKFRPDYISGEEKRKAREQETELRIFFMDRVVQLYKIENMHRKPSLEIAARDTLERARAIYGTEPRQWRIVDHRALEKRFAAIAQAYERKGYPPAEFTGDGRVLPRHYSLADLRGKRGGPQKKRTRRPL